MTDWHTFKMKSIHIDEKTEETDYLYFDFDNEDTFKITTEGLKNLKWIELERMS